MSTTIQLSIIEKNIKTFYEKYEDVQTKIEESDQVKLTTNKRVSYENIYLVWMFA